MTTFEPRIGVFGKTGAGKSSLCNALFGQRTAKVSNEELNQPGRKQATNIKTKLEEVRRIFKVGRKLPVAIAVSADEKYGLVDLVNTILERLPNEKKYGFAREVRDEHISAKAESSVKRGFWNAFKETAHNFFIEVAPALIEKGIKWIFKNLATIVKTVV